METGDSQSFDNGRDDQFHLSQSFGVLILSHPENASPTGWNEYLHTCNIPTEIFAPSQLSDSSSESPDEKFTIAFTELEQSLISIQNKYSHIFLIATGDDALFALKLSQIYGEQITGIILHNPQFTFSFQNDSKISRAAEKALAKSAQEINSHLYLITQPLLLSHSPVANDDRLGREGLLQEASGNIRELIFDNPLPLDAPLDNIETLYEQSVQFISDVLEGEFSSLLTYDDEKELIDSEFHEIVSGLNLDQSAPSDYLDELERLEEGEKYDPYLLPKVQKRWPKSSIALFIFSILYLGAYWIFDFDPVGFGSWPGLLAFVASISVLIYHSAEEFKNQADDDKFFEDGSAI